MIILGVDPGTRATGYGVVGEGDDGTRLLECGVIRPPRDESFPKRLARIHDGIRAVIARTRPDVLSVEGVFYAANVRTTVMLGQVRGVVLLAAAIADLPVSEYPPAEVKSAVVGSGAARKDQVAMMVKEHLGLAQAPSPSDAADGTAVALCHLFRHSRVAAGRRYPSGRGGVGRKLRR